VARSPVTLDPLGMKGVGDPCLGLPRHEETTIQVI
jgi:hypothetical protein